MDRSTLENWLAAYGSAWEERDADAFASLFAPGVRYHWTPFEEPKQGRSEVAEAFRSAVARQRAIVFRSTVLAIAAEDHIAHWHCSFDRIATGQRVRLDGIFLMRFDASGQCTVFREWWHSDEAA